MVAEPAPAPRTPAQAATGVAVPRPDEAASLAAALGASRAVDPPADRGRGLLMTLLGEFVLPSGGAVWTQTLLDALGGLGVNDKAARQVIARMHEHGRLERVRVGRRTRWMLSEGTRSLLEAGAERIYGFGRQPRPWDGRWVLLLASIPERDRRARYRMNVGLGWAGFGSLGGGIWVSPWVEQEAAAVALLRDLEVTATSFVSELGRLGDPVALAAQAWDLPTLRRQYEAFLAATATASVPAAATVPDGTRSPDGTAARGGTRSPDRTRSPDGTRGPIGTAVPGGTRSRLGGRIPDSAGSPGGAGPQGGTGTQIGAVLQGAADGNEARSDRDAALALTVLVHRWRQFPFADPGLPQPLLAADWPGPAAAARFAAVRSALVEPASRWWRSAEAARTDDR